MSGVGIIPPLPLLEFALVLITAVYLLRGLAVLPALLLTRNMVTPFFTWSSVVCIGFGITHLLGLAQVWSRL